MILRRSSQVPAPSRSGYTFSEQKNCKNKSTNLFQTNSTEQTVVYQKQISIVNCYFHIAYIFLLIEGGGIIFFCNYILNTLSDFFNVFSHSLTPLPLFHASTGTLHLVECGGGRGEERSLANELLRNHTCLR